MLRKKRKLKIEKFTLFITLLSFLLFSILIPIYDNVNKFHNILFDDYELIWYDGRSPENFYIISNLIHNKTVNFSKGHLIGGIPVENLFDFVEKNEYYIPGYNFFATYLFAAILFFIPFTGLSLFKIIVFLVMIFSTIILMLFYFVQKLLGMKVKFALMSTFFAGIATSIFIYSRYLFLRELFMTLSLLLLIYFILRNWKKPTLKNDLLISFTLSFFLLFFSDIILNLLFFVVFSYLFSRYKLINSFKVYFSILFVSMIIMFLFVTSFYSGIPTFESIGLSGSLFFKIFPRYISALDYAIYGFHDPSSVWKLDRQFSYGIYTFQELKGNAIFLHFYGLFGSLFGPKGFVYNSPYLVFSILGIFLYKEINKKNLILLVVVLLILLYGLISPFWYGGVTPRYVRFFTIPILFLTFFSFYYIQETKSILAKLLFLCLVILSILNVISLSIRTDWTYEHEADLVSYDMVLWPWYSPKSQEDIINLYLTEQGESVEWNFWGEAECKSFNSLEGIITDVCKCEYATYAERNIKIPWERVRINITVCSKNGDGVIGRFYFDKIEKEIFIPPNSCKRETILIENSEEMHRIALKSKGYGECIDESVIWKLITIEKI